MSSFQDRLVEHRRKELMAAALAYAADGRAVFPCKPDKSPYTSHGLKDATCDPDVIEQWWIKWPDAMIGAPVPAGMIVIDLDADDEHGGQRSDIPEITTTNEVATRGIEHPSRHFTFTVPAGFEASDGEFKRRLTARHGRETAGWDLRIGGKHYVILPPSRRDTGEFYWQVVHGSPTPAGPELLELMAATPKPAPAPVPVLSANAGTSGGTISDYNARTTISSILIRHGWQLVKGDGDSDGSEWRHPAATAAISATVRGSRLYNYSTNTGFPLAGTREGGQSPFDVHTHLDHGGNEMAALDAIRGTIALPTIALPAAQPGGGTEIGADDPRRLKVLTATDVEITRVKYLWEQRIPLGAMTLLPGEEGIGKTTVGVRLIADITRGRLPGEHSGQPRDVLVIAPEDGIADVFTPRLREAGADLARVHFIQAAIVGTDTEHDIIVPRDLDLIGAEVEKRQAAFVWIDSLVTTLPDGMKSTEYKATATVLKRLGQFAEQHGIAVAAPWHLNKTTGSDTAVRIMDSRAFRTAVRSMLLIVPDPDVPADAAERVGLIGVDKVNASGGNVPVLRYRIRKAHYMVGEVDQDTGQIHERQADCGVAEWVGQYDGGLDGLRDALAPRVSRDDDPKVWLRNWLDTNGPTLRTDVIKAAGDDGFSRAAIDKAAQRIGVVSSTATVPQPGGKPPRTLRSWALPAAGGKTGHLPFTGRSSPEPTSRETEETEETEETGPDLRTPSPPSSSTDSPQGPFTPSPPVPGRGSTDGEQHCTAIPDNA